MFSQCRQRLLSLVLLVPPLPPTQAGSRVRPFIRMFVWFEYPCDLCGKPRAHASIQARPPTAHKVTKTKATTTMRHRQHDTAPTPIRPYTRRFWLKMRILQRGNSRNLFPIALFAPKNLNPPNRDVMCRFCKGSKKTPPRAEQQIADSFRAATRKRNTRQGKKIHKRSTQLFAIPMGVQHENTKKHHEVPTRSARKPKEIA